MSLPTLAVVGTGAVARAIARAHVDAGGRVACIRSRDPARAAHLASRVASSPASGDADLAAADVVVVAVADRAIANVGARLAAIVGEAGPPVLHTSGALPASALGEPPLRAGSLHPLQSLPTPPHDDADGDWALAARLVGCHWFHEGDGQAESRLLVRAWGGHFHALAGGAKALYHAAAAIVSNHTVALFESASQILREAGIDDVESRAPLAALLEGTAGNLRAVGAPGALTGPVSRGDVGTVERHVEALRTTTPHLLASYVEVALLAVDVAVRRGTIDTPTAERLRAVLAS